MKKLLLVLSLSGSALLMAQSRDMLIELMGGNKKPIIAVPDFRGSGDAQKFMGTFNQTLFSELQGSGRFDMSPKSIYPLQVPQQPSELKPPSTPTAGRRTPASNGPWLTDWSGAPVNANYLAFGYAGTQNNQFVLYGWLFNVTQPDITSAQLIGKIYFGPMDENGAKKVARDFAADILQQFGAKSLAGSKVFFVSDRTGNKEIWSMDYDGGNQKPVTSYHSISTMPAVSPDGQKVAFTSYLKGTPGIVVHSTETGRRVPFYNQVASLNATPEFTPDGKNLLFSSTAAGGYAQLYETNVDGSNLRRLSSVRAIDIEPKVNPKTGQDIVFVSGRGGLPQLYKMNSDGADIVRLTNGEGEAVNPSWHPEGKFIAFAWTRGFEPGNYNIFIMDVSTREIVQLTHGAGRHENPYWAPDGLHIVYSSKIGRTTHIYTMLADGSQIQQLTTQGNNMQPVWAKGTN